MSEQPTPAAEPKITFDDFVKVHLRVGKVLEASNHPNADKLIVLKVDLGQRAAAALCRAAGGTTSPRRWSAVISSW